jgi:hypothetical protein
MAVPSINPCSPVAYATNQDFTYQLSASNYPSYYSLDAGQVLPSGVMFDRYSGRLFGASATEGIWHLTIYATNSDGTSAPAYLTFSAYAPAYLGSITKKVNIETNTMLAVFLDGSTDYDTYAKLSDAVLFDLSFTTGGVAISPRIASAKVGIKALDTEEYIFQTDDTNFSSKSIFVDGNIKTYFYILCDFASDGLKERLALEAADSGTKFDFMAEIELKVESPSMRGNPVLTVTTKTFKLRLVNDFVA